MNIKKILVSDRLYDEFASRLNSQQGIDFRFVPQNKVTKGDLEWADAYVGFKPAPNFDFANLQWVHCLGAGVDGFLYRRQWKSGVLLTRTVASFGQKISEFCLSYMLSDLQKHTALKKAQDNRIWAEVQPLSLRGQQVVVFGTGVIGQELARSLAFFGAEVLGISLSGQAKEPFRRVVKPEHMGNVLTDCDWVISTLPLTAETENLFNSDVFGLMRNAGFINVGRGASVTEIDLLEALEKNQVRLAILDVFREEPLTVTSPLWKHPQILITPHISAITSIKDALESFLSTLDNLQQGIEPPNQVDVGRGY